MDNPARILDTATRMFARRGFDGTSLQVIAAEVGISKPSLLYHYPSKDELRRAVLDNLFEHFREVLPGLLEAVTSGRQRFDALTGELLGFFRADADRARLVLREALDRPDDLRRRLGESLRPWVLLIGEYVRQGQAAGRIHGDVEPEAYVVQVVLLVVSAVASYPALVGSWSPAARDGAREGARDGAREEPAEDRYYGELTRLARAALFDASRKAAPHEKRKGKK
jgi:TetR/AcrR family transcriptional regulator